MTATPSHCTMAATTRTEMMCVPPAGFAEWVASTHIFRIADSIGRTAPDFHLLLGYDITDTLCSPGLRYCGSRATTPPGSECSAFSWAQCAPLFSIVREDWLTSTLRSSTRDVFHTIAVRPVRPCCPRWRTCSRARAGTLLPHPAPPRPVRAAKRRRSRRRRRRRTPTRPSTP